VNLHAGVTETADIRLGLRLGLILLPLHDIHGIVVLVEVLTTLPTVDAREGQRGFDTLLWVLTGRLIVPLALLLLVLFFEGTGT
jgi:hypothetical protein